MARRTRPYEPKRPKDTRHRINRQIPKLPRIIPEEPADEDRFYVVEQILKRRVDLNTGETQYLVRWKNYLPEDDSWEPEEEIQKNCRDLIKNFLDKSLAAGPSDENHYCICKRKYHFDQGGMIQCFHCLEWYHFTCLKMNMEEANSFAKWYCKECREKNSELKCRVKDEKLNTFYGKSLAGLHN